MKMPKRTKRQANADDAGYTLSELLIVLAVLAMVAAAVTPALFSRFNSGKVRSAQLQANTISMAMDEFLVDVGRYPSVEEGVQALWTAPDGVGGWRGPYVRSPGTLLDPWNNYFVIQQPSIANVPPSVVSLGADGAPGGEGLNADIAVP